MPPGKYVPVKQTSFSKSLRKFTETLDIKPKTTLRRLCSAKSKRKAVREGSMLWSSIPKLHIHTKINECVKTDKMYSTPSLGCAISNS